MSNSKTAIFIRSYRGDFDWLKYCLQSIQLFCTGFSEVVVVFPAKDRELVGELNMTSERVIFEDDKYAHDDYLGQQATKINAWKYVSEDVEFISIVDSDCIFNKPTTPDDLIKDGKPILLKTPYTKVPEAGVWKGVTEKACGFEVTFEYMRRLPFTFRRDTFIAIRNWFEVLHGMPIDKYIGRQKNREFSEFNLMGAFAEKYESHKYDIQNTEEIDLQPAQIRQFWSWGGVTNEVRHEIELIFASK